MTLEEIDRLATERAQRISPAPKLEPITGAGWSGLSILAAFLLDDNISKLIGHEWSLLLSLGIVAGGVWLVLRRQQSRYFSEWARQYQIAHDENIDF